jgi:hypothetical protein
MSRRRAIAIHEAGHAVVGAELGWRPLRVTMRPRVVFFINSEHALREERDFGRVEFEGRADDRPALERAAVLIAGLAAEMLERASAETFEENWTNTSSICDRACFEQLARQLRIAPEHLFREAFTVAARILHERWHVVIKLAGELAKRREIVGRAAQAWAAGRGFAPDRPPRRRRARKRSSERPSADALAPQAPNARRLVSGVHRFGQPTEARVDAGPT